MPQFDFHFYPLQIFWFFVSFFILWGGLHFSIIPLMESLRKERNTALQALLAEAVAMQKEAEELRRADASALALAQEHSACMIAEALERKEEERQKCLRRLRQDYSTRIHNLCHTLEQQAEKWQKVHLVLTARQLGREFFHHHCPQEVLGLHGQREHFKMPPGHQEVHPGA